MKKIELFEKAIAERAASLKEWGINPTLFWAYRNSITAGNGRIDFGEAIWDSEVGEIAETLQAAVQKIGAAALKTYDPPGAWRGLARHKLHNLRRGYLYSLCP